MNLTVSTKCCSKGINYLETWTSNTTNNSEKTMKITELTRGIVNYVTCGNDGYEHTYSNNISNVNAWLQQE